MGKRRKNRTHLKGKNAVNNTKGSADAPKSFVIKHGQVGASVTQLVRDMRKVMEPNTAARLRVSDSIIYFNFIIYSALNRNAQRIN